MRRSRILPRPRKRSHLRLAPLLAILLGALTPAAPAVAQGPACPEGNLLAGKTPRQWSDIRGRLELITDGVVAQEGAVWNAPLAVVLDTGAAVLTYDLGGLTRLEALHGQFDANDTYKVWGSLDGRDYRLLAEVPSVVETAGHGLRSRSVPLGGVAARFLRVGEGLGDNFYSIAELQAFCKLPTPFPPALKVGVAPVQKAKKTIYDYWNDETSARWELVLALLALGLLAWSYFWDRTGRAQKLRRLRNGLLGAIGVLSFATYFNFGFFHFGNYIHNWDVFHYYVGSKYFRELSYDKLYECVAIADAEDGLRRRVELRKMTNLRTNELEPSTEILANPDRCKRHFTDARWASFKRDVAFFRNREGPKRWDDVSTDHGYNATPVWNIAGTLLSNTGPATYTQVLLLTLLDPLYLAGTALVVWWAFGWRVLCVALAVFATNFPSRFYWTGGAFLRWDWIFYMVAAVCCLKKDRPLLGGLALGYSTLLRVFPGFLFLGPLLALGIHWLRDRRWERQSLRFLVGGALAAALLVPLSLPFSGGPRAYVQFVQNTQKHKETPLTNAMGLRTVLGYRPSEVGRKLRSDALVDPWSKWKAAKARAFKETKPLLYLIVALTLAALAFAVRALEPWAATALAATFCAFPLELTSYYYAFIIVPALLYEKRKEVGLILLGCTAFTQLVAWAPIGRYAWLSNKWVQMSTWFDEQHTLYSLATVLAFALILATFALAARARSGPRPAPSERSTVEERKRMTAADLWQARGSRRDR